MIKDDSSVWQPSLTLMNPARIEQLHNAATAIPNDTGLNVHQPEVRARLRDAGARLGAEARAYLAPDLVEAALSTAKKDVVVHNRLGEPVMPLGPHQIFFGTGSHLMYTHDAETGERPDFPVVRLVQGSERVRRQRDVLHE
ncbi:MAG: trimethylamine methyltransferase family protein [Anaerolineae bacterium]|jgi:trimethylamine:corrinoid methyltransferase-like protein